ncbi:MAG: tRNA guanosine(34) transglycosylase Tgt [Chitinispirillales bacterium]|jgi:queuine tRNA-ribosyltransferase|nr:tRNA guanosine(34) transglycosylase Tgt [Chitinispirillales bacterium]
MPDKLSFRLIATDAVSAARAATFSTAHSTVETPIFMPVGTQATVKSMSPLELRQCGCPIILANTYHLHLRPGAGLIREAGGLHKFESWNGSILTDSGGFQVFSLRDISKITDDGVEFQSHIDGSRHFFSPEKVMEIQHDLGADIIMVFDECPPSNADPVKIKAAVDRTLVWASRCLEKHQNLHFHHGYPQNLFGIVQGGVVEPLREYCARELVAMNFPGYAIGGLAVGEEMKTMYKIAAYTAGLLPEDKPRYLMGVGTPIDILECISAGVDMFDCVLPTRNARNGSVFTSAGKLNIRNAAYTRDFARALDENCNCYACSNFSRSYIRHLYMAGEILAIRLMTLHNIHFYMELVKNARERIIDGTFSEWKREMIVKMANDAQ